MSARYLYTELPEWELNVLLGEHGKRVREARAKAQGQGG